MNVSLTNLVNRSREILAWFFGLSKLSLCKRLGMFSSGTHMPKITDSIIDSQDFGYAFERYFNLLVEKNSENSSKLEKRCSQYLDTAYSLNSISISSSQGPPTDTSDDEDRTN